MANNWAIVIGINEYRFLQPLKYAKRDAEAMQNFLAQEAKFDRVFLFTDDSLPINGKPTDPIRNNLLRVLRQIFASPFMKDGDNFWFFFSGHGIRHNEQDYLMPIDGDPEDVENTGIPTNTITSYLRSCGADNVVMILDACRSGGKKAGEGIGRQTEEEARQTGVISIFSCSPDQYSYELEAIGQGAFTYTLLEGLSIRGQCATVERLNQYLQSQVPQLVQQHLGRVRQTPYTIAEPINRSHLILMSQYASLGDIATLKNDAYRAQTRQEWDLAQRLWIRVLAAASGQDIEAIEALQEIGFQRRTGALPPQPQSPQFSKTTESTKASAPSSVPPSPQTPATLPPPQPLPSSQPPIATPQSLFSQNEIPISSRPAQTSQSPVSRPLNRQQFLKWLLLAGGGAAGVAIASQFLGEQAKHAQVDYSKLEGFLKARQWKEANQETNSLMLKVANREQQGYLDSESINNFPCDVLSEIDRLWVDKSGGKFGFSVQKKIYLEDCGAKPDGQYDEKAYLCFADAVGWRVNNNWVSYTEVKFDTTAPRGHLPLGLLGVCWGGGCGGENWYMELGRFFSHTEVCKL